MKQKLETGNWKRKLETEMQTKDTNHWCNIFFVMCLVITQVFYSAIVMGLAL